MKIEDAVEKILSLDRERKVKFIILYGSHARGKARKDSDIDLCIYYDGTKREAFQFRMKVLGELPDNYDIQIFDLLPVFIRKECLKGVILFCKDWEFLYDVAYKTIEEFEDFKRYYYDYLGLEAIE
ncbi:MULTISPECIES: nucleotidyltransferase domain-containing protein [Thermococcus]|uniref:Nucleotidyltransferase n=2 Tax=Thermococcus sibiricus TaxID=172049 RepID=C6A3T3_THESM|nr:MULTISPECIES: nucleotidyltransferase domain-containing protein [Thermococcus]KUK28598.1 MAG: Nucleotidyltransferase [Thermococcus sp. 40_45]HII67481.1 nucleotidyltransferase domain-containing protein [Thermococcaceae archaeon]ACS90278.1 Nucleotidyltransferase [Thermococcus sibiricus MM 739]KUK17112.1 MAG: Nucleotidyltransferase [Thermococcus sibiricus]MBC7095309.1 nucleotidyltransferase domain-containing protein [Thermococcus sp.]